MVTKFLTRETTYATLLTAVAENERKLEELREQNDHKNDLLNALKINFENKDLEKYGKKTSDADDEMIQLQQEIKQYQGQLDGLNARKNNINLVCDQVQGWAGKVKTQLTAQLENIPENNWYHIENQGDQMSQQFKFIENIVCGELFKVIQENKRRQEEDLERGVNEPSEHYNIAEEFNQNNQDLINDVGTEEFISKNIRVRPQSGQTAIEKEDRQSNIINDLAERNVICFWI